MTDLLMPTAEMEKLAEQIRHAPADAIVITTDKIFANKAADLHKRSDLVFYGPEVLDADNKHKAVRNKWKFGTTIVVENGLQFTMEQAATVGALPGLKLATSVPAALAHQPDPQLLADVMPWSIRGTGLIIRDKSGKPLMTLRMSALESNVESVARDKLMELMDIISRKIEGRAKIAPILPQHR